MRKTMAGDADMLNQSDTVQNGVIDVEQYRRLVKSFIDMRRYQTALFWAEKVCVLSQNEPKDIYCQAQCMFQLHEYHRAAHIIKLHALEKLHIPCYSLLLESLYEAKEFAQAVSVINTVDVELLAASLLSKPTEKTADSQSLLWNDDSAKNELLASICYLKGKIYEAMDNRILAMDFYVQALQKSVYCYEALEALVKHEMLMAWEEKELLEHLPLQQQASEAEAKMITCLYESKLKKYYESLSNDANPDQAPIGELGSLKSIKLLIEKMKSQRESDIQTHKNVMPKLFTPQNIMSPASKVLEDLKNTPLSLQLSLSRNSSNVNDSQHPAEPNKRKSLATKAANESTGKDGKENKVNKECKDGLPLATCLQRLRRSTDMMASEAEKLYYDCEYKKSIKILTELLKIDPYHNTGLTLQIGCLVEFGDYNKLFYLAHKLVDLYPDRAISWYAVGCYYDLIGKSDPARRFLSKATSLDRLYGPAWLAYGHSFAKENEHDQAMAAYFKATQLMRGCHLPLLYIGVECGLTKNLELAEKFFYQSMSIAPLDVFVLHELGVIKYEYEYYNSAEEVFRATAEIVTNRAKQNKEEVSPRWEPLFNNLGHCCRKTKKYEEALTHHKFALLLKPQSAPTLTAIGFVHALMGQLEEAITYFHKSLAINRDCIVTSTILKTCIEDMMDQESSIEQICGTDNSAPPLSVKLKTKRLSTIDEHVPSKFDCMKPRLDEEGICDNIDDNLIMDISMNV